jgi:hypothetical protein
MLLPKYLNQELIEKRSKLVQEIEKKRRGASSLRENPVVKKYKQIQNARIKEARIHAARGEVPLSELHYRPNAVDKERYSKVLEGIEDAWDAGIVMYYGTLDDTILKQLAWNLDPEFFGGETAYFRRPSSVLTTVDAWKHVPPEPSQELPNDLYSYITNNPEIENHTIPEQAIFYNMHLARIQPFPDCNKRLGKLIQNLHLNLYHYPPATILEGEAEFYNCLLGEAITGFKEREGKGNVSTRERRFFEFVGTRINNNLNSILDLGKPQSPQIGSRRRRNRKIPSSRRKHR